MAEPMEYLRGFAVTLRKFLKIGESGKTVTLDYRGGKAPEGEVIPPWPAAPAAPPPDEG